MYPCQGFLFVKFFDIACFKKLIAKHERLYMPTQAKIIWVKVSYNLFCSLNRSLWALSGFAKNMLGPIPNLPAKSKLAVVARKFSWWKELSMSSPSIINFNFSCKNPLGVMSEAIFVQRITEINLSTWNFFSMPKDLIYVWKMRVQHLLILF